MIGDYTIKDMKEALAGAFVTTLFFFAIRSGETFTFLDPWVGFGVTLVWFIVIFKSFDDAPNGEHFLMNSVIVYLFCVVLAIAFKLATFEQIRANPFGNPAMIATWMAMPVALLFDKFNISSVLSRYYIKK